MAKSKGDESNRPRKKIVFLDHRMLQQSQIREIEGLKSSLEKSEVEHRENQALLQKKDQKILQLRTALSNLNKNQNPSSILLEANSLQRMNIRAAEVSKELSRHIIEQFLSSVVHGKLDKVDADLKNYPLLNEATGDIRDREEGIITKVTGLQCAAWALDLPMCELILKSLPYERARDQWEAFVKYRHDLTDRLGVHFNLNQLITTLKVYINIYDDLTVFQRWRYWKTQVGREHARLPAWVVYFWPLWLKDGAWSNKDISRASIGKEIYEFRLGWSLANNGMIPEDMESERGFNEYRNRSQASEVNREANQADLRFRMYKMCLGDPVFSDDHIPDCKQYLEMLTRMAITQKDIDKLFEKSSEKSDLLKVNSNQAAVEPYVRIQTIGDGNCAYNSAALGISDLIIHGLLPKSDASKKLLTLIYSSDSATDQLLFEDLSKKSENERQRFLAPHLRSLAVDYIQEKYLYYADSFEMNLKDEFNCYKNNKIIGEMFCVHGFILQQFMSIGDENELLLWWHSSGKDKYFQEIRKGGGSRAQWGSEIELDAIAVLFDVMIRIEAERNGQISDMSCGEGFGKLNDDFTEDERKQLHRYGVCDKRHEKYFLKVNDQFEIKNRLKKLDDEICKALDHCIKAAEASHDRDCTESLAEYIEILKDRLILKETNVTTYQILRKDVSESEIMNAKAIAKLSTFNNDKINSSSLIFSQVELLSLEKSGHLSNIGCAKRYVLPIEGEKIDVQEIQFFSNGLPDLIDKLVTILQPNRLEFKVKNTGAHWEYYRLAKNFPEKSGPMISAHPGFFSPSASAVEPTVLDQVKEGTIQAAETFEDVFENYDQIIIRDKVNNVYKAAALGISDLIIEGLLPKSDASEKLLDLICSNGSNPEKTLLAQIWKKSDSDRKNLLAPHLRSLAMEYFDKNYDLYAEHFEDKLRELYSVCRGAATGYIFHDTFLRSKFNEMASWDQFLQWWKSCGKSQYFKELDGSKNFNFILDSKIELDVIALLFRINICIEPPFRNLAKIMILGEGYGELTDKFTDDQKNDLFRYGICRKRQEKYFLIVKSQSEIRKRLMKLDGEICKVVRSYVKNYIDIRDRDCTQAFEKYIPTLYNRCVVKRNDLLVYSFTYNFHDRLQLIDESLRARVEACYSSLSADRLKLLPRDADFSPAELIILRENQILLEHSIGIYELPIENNQINTKEIEFRLNGLPDLIDKLIATLKIDRPEFKLRCNYNRNDWIYFRKKLWGSEASDSKKLVKLGLFQSCFLPNEANVLHEVIVKALEVEKLYPQEVIQKFLKNVSNNKLDKVRDYLQKHPKLTHAMGNISHKGIVLKKVTGFQFARLKCMREMTGILYESLSEKMADDQMKYFDDYRNELHLLFDSAEISELDNIFRFMIRRKPPHLQKSIDDSDWMNLLPIFAQFPANCAEVIISNLGDVDEKSKESLTRMCRSMPLAEFRW